MFVFHRARSIEGQKKKQKLEKHDDDDDDHDDDEGWFNPLHRKRWRLVHLTIILVIGKS